MPQLDREAAFIPADLQNSGQATRMNAHRQDWACRTCVAGTNMRARNPACWRTVLRLCGLTTNLVFPGRPSPLPGWLQPNAGNDGLRERRGRPAIAVVHRSASPKVADGLLAAVIAVRGGPLRRLSLARSFGYPPTVPWRARGLAAPWGPNASRGRREPLGALARPMGGRNAAALPQIG